MDQKAQFIADYLRGLLSVTDGFSRFLLGCQALHSTAVAGNKPVFTHLSKEYGLPKRIRTDNASRD
jgi:hypothetical protein